MKGAVWASLAARNPAIRFLDVNLRGAGQVIFQDNPLSGALFLAAIIVGSLRADAPEVIAGAVAGLVVSTVTALLLHADGESLNQGLFGFNGVLVGVAAATFLESSAAMWLLTLVGAAASTVVMLAVSKALEAWKLPALTFPFVLTTWPVLLGAYAFEAVTIGPMAPPVFVESTAAHPATGDVDLLPALLKAPAQVFLINDSTAGVLVLLGLAVGALPAAAAAVLGSAAALAVALALGTDPAATSAGLYGFSPVLTAVAVGCVFRKPSWRVAAYALFATVFTVIVQAALNTGLSPAGIPALTMPFVLVTWLFLLGDRETE